MVTKITLETNYETSSEDVSIEMLLRYDGRVWSSWRIVEWWEDKTQKDLSFDLQEMKFRNQERRYRMVRPNGFANYDTLLLFEDVIKYPMSEFGWMYTTQLNENVLHQSLKWGPSLISYDRTRRVFHNAMMEGYRVLPEEVHTPSGCWRGSQGEYLAREYQKREFLF